MNPRPSWPRLPFVLGIALVLSSSFAPPATGFAADSDGVWSIVSPPSARYGHTLVLDAPRDRMIVFGGYDEIRHRDVWTLGLGTPAWTRLEPAGTRPVERFGHAAIADAARGRMIVFGGEVESGVDWINQTWSLTLGATPTWTQLVPAGPLPAGRTEHSMVHDAARDRAIVFGGRAGATLFDDAWALTLGDTPTWSRIDAVGPGPSARSGHVAVFDAAHDRMIVYGGTDGASRQDAWQLSLSGTPTWTPLATSGSGPAGERAAAVLDAAGNRMIVFGGRQNGVLSDQAWALDLDALTWSQLSTGTKPSNRYRHAAAWDATRGRMIVVGGSDPSLENDAWALTPGDAPSWTKLLDLGSAGPWRIGPTMVHDPVGDRMLLFAGVDGDDPRDDVRALRLSGSPRWSSVDAPRIGLNLIHHTTIYDPVRRRLVSFGGYMWNVASIDETWVLSLDDPHASWARLATSGAPGGRSNHVAIYDPRRDRMIVFTGGNHNSGAWETFSDVWTLQLSDSPTWTQLLPEGAGPSARGFAAAVYDPLRDRMLMYGGSGTHETWELALAGTPHWTLLATDGAPPSAVQMCGAIYDPIRDRLVVNGGIDSSAAPTTNTWALDLTVTPHRWSRMAPAGPILPATRDDDRNLAYDPRRDRMIAHGGWDHPDGIADTWALSWGNPVKPVVQCASSVEWNGSTSVTARFTVSNPLGGPRAIDWTVGPDRAWQGLPLRGTAIVEAGASDTIEVVIPVPDTASAGSALLRFEAFYAGAMGNASSCEGEIVDITTAALPSLITAAAEPGRARLAWSISTPDPIEVWRREPETAWRTIATIVPESDVARYEDVTVEPGRRYGYRIAWQDDAGSRSVGEETWLDIPNRATLALLGTRPNPARGDVRVALTLPYGGSVGLELFDIAGRRIVALQTANLEPGLHVVPLARADEVTPGVYLVRMRFEDRAVETRVVVTK